MIIKKKKKSDWNNEIIGPPSVLPGANNMVYWGQLWKEIGQKALLCLYVLTSVWSQYIWAHCPSSTLMGPWLCLSQIQRYQNHPHLASFSGTSRKKKQNAADYIFITPTGQMSRHLSSEATQDRLLSDIILHLNEASFEQLRTPNKIRHVVR